MASRTIHTLAYKMMVDSSQFIKGTTTTRQEINHAKREMIAMQTPAEKMEISLAKLGQLAQKDARFQELYNQKLVKYNELLRKNRKAAGIFAKTAGKIRGAFFNMQTAVAAVAGSAIASGVKSRMNQIDALGKSAEAAGVSTEFLSRMQFALGQMSGLTAEQVTKAIESSTRRIGEAALGTGEAVQTLKQLGLDPNELLSKTPEERFNALGEAIRKIPSQASQFAAAGKIYGEEAAKIATAIGDTTGAFDALLIKSDEIGNTISQLDYQKVASANDAMDSMAKSFSGLSTQLTTVVAPTLEGIADEITQIM